MLPRTTSLTLLAPLLLVARVPETLGAAVFHPAHNVTHHDGEGHEGSELASEIVKQLRALAMEHRLPTVLQQAPYYNEISDPGFLQEEDPPSPPTHSPSGFNIQGTLGLVEYLILLILLKGSLTHVAERYNASLKSSALSHRRTRRAAASWRDTGGDLRGRADLLRTLWRGDLENRILRGTSQAP